VVFGSRVTAPVWIRREGDGMRESHTGRNSRAARQAALIGPMVTARRTFTSYASPSPRRRERPTEQTLTFGGAQDHLRCGYE